MKIIALLFLCISAAAQIAFTYPVNFQGSVPRSCTLTWTASLPPGGTYKLYIGTGPGTGPQSKNVASRVTTNNWITVNLPLTNTLYCHIYGLTPYTLGSDLLFSTTADAPNVGLYPDPPAFTNDTDAAVWATAQVHYMRSCEGASYPWSLLYLDSTDAHKSHPYCSDMAVTAVDLCNRLGLTFGGHPPRVLQLAFRLGTVDTHTIATVYDQASQNWILLDPLFGMTLKRADGTWATKEDQNAATVGKNWGAITYVALCDDLFAFAHAYTLDYPLCYLQIPAVNYDTGIYQFSSITNPVAPYLDLNGNPKRYVF